MDEPPIVKLIHRYYPEWVAPRQGRGRWHSCLCPFHGDENKSASVSYEYNAFHCFVCDAGGDMVKIIRQKEGASYSDAKRLAEAILAGSDGAVPAKPARVSRRKVFGNKGIGGDSEPEGAGRDRQVSARVRGRTAPWA